MEAAGDGGGEGVAMDDFLLRAIKVESGGIDQQEVGARTEALDGQLHGQPAGLVDVDLVDPGGIDFGDGPGKGVPADAQGEPFAVLLGEQLGVAQSADAVGGIEDAGGGGDTAEERSAPTSSTPATRRAPLCQAAFS